ncbi:Mobile element protein [Ochrobactrum soli]|uniref:Mobile element protein n=1 Tax=Ochrobactrum soli TaxID=2448455 RepID=A0A2P9HEI9_9HYPH|nr:Mobile element protein [[Ochrobactrum] soli]
MISFIDEHRSVFGVEPICRLLPIAPSTYYENVAKRLDVDRLSVRARSDIALGCGIRVHRADDSDMMARTIPN